MAMFYLRYKLLTFCYNLIELLADVFSIANYLMVLGSRSGCGFSENSSGHLHFLILVMPCNLNIMFS